MTRREVVAALALLMAILLGSLWFFYGAQDGEIAAVLICGVPFSLIVVAFLSERWRESNGEESEDVRASCEPANVSTADTIYTAACRAGARSVEGESNVRHTCNARRVRDGSPNTPHPFDTGGLPTTVD